MRGLVTKLVIPLALVGLFSYLVLPGLVEDQMKLQGVALHDARADLRDVSVAIPSLLEGSPGLETRSCSLASTTPALRIDQNQACSATWVLPDPRARIHPGGWKGIPPAGRDARRLTQS
ncbi:MAG: hypothetical protein AVDCRST_MAG03-3846 [uncultured Rubrobacteraceae bacterium]|uniref:Uncharacterized protein n=1 Tax=uncultured Rubrobacteraceae bacterium TaxID=349277 RepID=A0A6J4QAL6_9ACTN|nr:MAG: hypothetical protein AVDCRST_MAG03-3846 [uncultured Rubrobacteraceae bacterium]